MEPREEITRIFPSELAYSNLVINSGELYNGKLKFKTLFDDDQYYRAVIKNSQHVNARIAKCRVVLANQEEIFPQLYTHSTAGDFPIGYEDII